MRAASSRPIARPRPKPPCPPVVEPRWKRSKISSRSAAGTPGPWSQTLSRAHPSAAATATSTLEVRRGDPQGVVEQDAHDLRHRARVGLRPAGLHGRMNLQPRPAGRRPIGRGGELELGGHRARELAELQRLAAQRDLGVEAAQVEQVGGQAREPARLLPARASRARGHPRCRAARSAGRPRAAPASRRARPAGCAARARPSPRTRGVRPPGGAAASACPRTHGVSSPTSSRPRSSGRSSASGPRRSSSRVASRSRSRRRSSVVARPIPSSSATSRPAPAASRNAVRTTRTAEAT